LKQAVILGRIFLKKQAAARRAGPVLLAGILFNLSIGLLYNRGRYDDGDDSCYFLFKSDLATLKKS